MKILFASQSFYPHIGGVSTYLLHLEKGLIKRGNEVTEIHLRPSGEANIDEIKGINILRVPKEPLDRELLKGYSKFKEAIYKECHNIRCFTKPPIEMEGYEEFDKINTIFGEQVREILEDDPPEMIDIHDFQLLFLYKFVPRGTPLVLRWHVPFTKEISKELSKFLIKHMKEYDKIVFSSPDYIDAAVEAGLPRKKTELIYPIANTNLFKKIDIDRDEVRKEYGIPTEAKVIICVQRVDPKSGHEQLIRSMPDILKKVPDAKLVFVGGESMSDKISKDRVIYKERVMGLIKSLKLSNNIIFTGNVEHTHLPELYNAADVDALTSKLEGFGLAVTEGMACGKPVIGTNVGGIPIQVEENKNGFLVDVGDYKTTAKRIITLLTDTELRKRMGDESLRLVREKFIMEIGVEKHLSMYTKLYREKHEGHRLELMDLDEIKAFITDYDRTITTEKPGYIPPALIPKLKSLKKTLILATGRKLSHVKKNICKKYPIWKCVVAENGCVIYFPKIRKTIKIDSSYQKKARKLLEKYNIPADIGDVIISCPKEYLQKLKKIFSKLNKHLDYRLNVNEIMVMPKGINKGKGLEIALNYMNIDFEKTVLVGDGENDVDMFNIPGFKVALANAIPKVKRLANQITEKSYFNGVIEVIEKLKQ